jgi:hypothetical protein
MTWQALSADIARHVIDTYYNPRFMSYAAASYDVAGNVCQALVWGAGKGGAHRQAGSGSGDVASAEIMPNCPSLRRARLPLCRNRKAHVRTFDCPPLRPAVLTSEDALTRPPPPACPDPASGCFFSPMKTNDVGAVEGRSRGQAIHRGQAIRPRVVGDVW